MDNIHNGSYKIKNIFSCKRNIIYCTTFKLFKTWVDFMIYKLQYYEEQKIVLKCSTEKYIILNIFGIRWTIPFDSSSSCFDPTTPKKKKKNQTLLEKMKGYSTWERYKNNCQVLHSACMGSTRRSSKPLLRIHGLKGGSNTPIREL